MNDTNGSLMESILSYYDTYKLKNECRVLLCLILFFLRWLIGLHNYSGAKNPPMYGDYEAQRHWMEITTQLPLSTWYFNSTENNLLYWGLDYPPLTAYVSYGFGMIANQIVPDMIVLESSKGYETNESKVYMRTTVLLCDLFILFPAIYALACIIYNKQLHVSIWKYRTAFTFLILSQPSFLLIDHGHFQYNNASLGLTAFAIAAIMQEYEVLGSIFYVMALNFKQMSLYYAPTIGIYLYARCIYRKSIQLFFLHFIKLGCTVLLTFTILWIPFCLAPYTNETCGSSMLQVLHRIFPFSRGLFEDKVANVWCIIDLFTKVRRRYPISLQMYLCTFTTFLAFLPSIIDLLRRKPTTFRLILSLVNSSLAFFLFSFQVHEKTILLTLLPISLLLPYNALIVGWFSLISTFSMFFLLQKDQLVLPYVILQCLYASIAVYPFLWKKSYLFLPSFDQAPGMSPTGKPHNYLSALVLISIGGMILLHLLQALVAPPSKYPHLFDYLFAIYSCGHFLLMLVYTTYWQWTSSIETQYHKKIE